MREHNSESMQGIQESQVCRDRLQDGLHRSVKRDSGLAMGHHLIPFSIKCDRLQPVMVYCGVYVLAVTIWDCFGQFVLLLISLILTGNIIIIISLIIILLNLKRLL